MSHVSLNPRTKALAFASALLLTSVVLVGTAVATTETALRPFLRGDQYGEERGLTRGSHVALGLRVAQMVDGQLKPVAGAQVVITRAAPPGSVEDRPVVTGTTNRAGAAIFDLKAGPYEIVVTTGSLTSHYALRLHQPTRLSLVFDSSGQAHWQQASHGDLERRGDMANLLIRVGRNESGERVPVANATVQIYRYTDRDTTVYVGEMKTGPRGFASFQLHKGPYLVKVSADGVSGEHGLRLQGGTTVGVLIDGSTMHWRIADNDSHQWTASPSPTRRPGGG